MFQGESTKIAISCELAALDTWPKQDHATVASRGRVVCSESAFFGKICSVNLPSWKLGKKIVRTFEKHWETRVKLVKPATVHWGKARGGGTFGSREALAGTTGRQGSTGSGLWVGWSLFERIRPRAKTQRIFAAFWLLTKTAKQSECLRMKLTAFDDKPCATQRGSGYVRGPSLTQNRRCIKLGNF